MYNYTNNTNLTHSLWHITVNVNCLFYSVFGIVNFTANILYNSPRNVTTLENAYMMLTYGVGCCAAQRVNEFVVPLLNLNNLLEENANSRTP